jgi:hypothetical protein
MRVWVDLTNSRTRYDEPRGRGPRDVRLHDVRGLLGAVDEALLHEVRPRRLTEPADVTLERRPEHVGLRVRRDPRELVKLLSAADS